MKLIQKMVLHGGTGQIGKAIINFYRDKVQEIIVFTRGESRKENNIHFLNWDGKVLLQYKELLEDTDVIINLVGKNVNCRYTEANKKEIFDSRTDSIKALSEVFQSMMELFLD